MSNAVIFHHRYDKSTASRSDTGKKTIQNRSERHFHASCSLLYRHPSICILYNRISPSFSFFFFFLYSEAASWFNRVYRWLAWETVSKELNENLNVPSLFLVRKAHDDSITDVRKNGWNMFEFISKVIAMLNEDFLVRNKD